MMPCYFCHSDTEQEFPNHGVWRCNMCSRFLEDGMLKVYCCLDMNDEKPWYAHIIIDRTLTSNRSYHIRLHLKEDYTMVEEPYLETTKVIFTVPSFPFTPKNVEQKLKIYLPFS